MSDDTRGGLFCPLGSPAPLRRERLPVCRCSKLSLSPRVLDRPVAVIRGVGRSTERKLKSLGVETVRDLLLHLPFRHEPPSRLVEVASLRFGEEVNMRACVLSCAVRETARRRVKVLEALVSDSTGSVLALWYNQPYLEPAFRERPEILLKGVLMRRRGRSVFLVKRHEILGPADESRHILGLVPVYPSTADLSVRTIRTILHEAAPLAQHLLDPLPPEMLARRRYPGKGEAVLCCHFPAGLEEASIARERLAFEELLLLQLAVLRRRQSQDRQEQARALAPPGPLATGFLSGLPFRPTEAQRRVIAELDADLQRTVPMRRLLHGDVGSGKTMVAAYCMLRAVEQGGQAALMAPTEVLADQHYLGLVDQLSSRGVKVGLLKGNQTASERRAVRAALGSGQVDVLIGTHALIQEGVRFKDLRLAVIDEQHRFGVRQRDAMLAGDGGRLRPHTLHMSATPIPRTLSLTLYGDLDVSVLDEMPAGRRPITTRLVRPEAQARMWQFVRAELTKGRQAYVVCPLIEESESLQSASASQTYCELAAGELNGFSLRLLHGQLPAAEKAAAMAAFSAGRVDVLVSTSVIEVGIDVPNATVMVILGARRFGLSQLHQLRGRVGRGAEASFCLLPVGDEDEAANERLSLFAHTGDGFALAEADLAARGTGQLFGERQSGLGDLQVASLVRDRRLLEEARMEAEALLGGVGAPELTRGRGAQTVAVSAAGPAARVAAVLEASEARFGSRMGWMERL